MNTILLVNREDFLLLNPYLKKPVFSVFIARHESWQFYFPLYIYRICRYGMTSCLKRYMNMNFDKFLLRSEDEMDFLPIIPLMKVTREI